MANTQSITVKGNKISLPGGDSGWYLFLGLMGGVLTANTQLAPWTFGILLVAFLYQTGQLLKGNNYAS